MAIPAKQIGQSAEANLLWQISKQLEILIKVVSQGNTYTTTSTTTTSSAIIMQYAEFGVGNACTNPIGSVEVTYDSGVSSYCNANVLFGDFSALQSYSQVVGVVDGYTSQWSVASSTQLNRSSSCNPC